ncbi:MBL fold metallo-hydrolase [Pseudomonas sp. DCB_AW]|jgi:beta-lactamase superfamily II metal-dependent hydrolase|uniref:ComEC/Rec2 family competence protein n=1 Tax=Pseudomonas sp. DCB_AW TaxID=2993596 RepID=UPI002248EFA3|nr:MBL fold metallo-hydrolase [Pseudomonas sp. DCB_AW]MCX2688086.1 MBL fold metallo-hydrolase [Pseudomonas sp. DCB_AW]
MKILMQKADYGDSVLIIGNTTKILIDGGTAKSFTQWSSSIQKIDKLDALFVSHIDNDHVGGAIRLLTSLHSNKVDRIYFNGANQIISETSTEPGTRHDAIELAAISASSTLLDEDKRIGYSEGTSLSFIIKSKGFETNLEFNGQAITRQPLEKTITVGEFKLSFLGPTKENLDQLRDNWTAVLKARGIKRRIIDKSYSSAFESYLSSIDQPMRSDQAISSNSDDIDYLAGRPFKDDDSLPNKSSISFLLRTESKSILMLADSNAATISSWLDENELPTLKVDAIKIPHHGSKNNFNVELIKRIDTSHYLISTNGKKSCHPDLETIARIVKYAPNRSAKIIINYNIQHLTKSFLMNIENWEGNISLHQNVEELEL